MILIVILAFIFELLILVCASPGIAYWSYAALTLHVTLLFAMGLRSLRRLVVGGIVIYSFFAPNPVMLAIFAVMVSITTGAVFWLCSGGE